MRYILTTILTMTALLGGTDLFSTPGMDSHRGTPSTERQMKPSKPNIILIFTDDQGYHDLGCFGSEKIKTPNLDRMADQGTILTHFYAQPVCGVSRAALMTGSYPIRVAEPGNKKQLHTIPHTDEITMAEVLKDAGYSTCITGKWQLSGNAYAPYAAGFDEYCLWQLTYAGYHERYHNPRVITNGVMAKYTNAE